MKPEAAIKQIEEDGITLQSMRAATNALERLIPMEPVTESDGYADGSEVWDYLCPRCNYNFEDSTPTFCQECGQRINWDINYKEI